MGYSIISAYYLSIPIEHIQTMRCTVFIHDPGCALGVLGSSRVMNKYFSWFEYAQAELLAKFGKQNQVNHHESCISLPL